MCQVRWTPGETTVTVWVARIRNNGVVNRSSSPESLPFDRLPHAVAHALLDCLADLATVTMRSEA